MAAESSAPPAGRRLTAPERTAVASASLFAFALALFRNDDLDWHWYVAVGRWIVEHRAVPHVEEFSFTAAGQPHRAEHWLGEVAFFLLFRLGGIPLLVTLKALLFAALTGTVTWWGARRAGAGPAAMLTALVMVASWDHLGLRLHAITPVFTVATLLILDRWRRRRRGLAWLVPLAALWANLHGSAPLIVVLAGAQGLACFLPRLLSGDRFDSRAKRDLSLTLLAVAAATLVNPYGWRLWQDAAQHTLSGQHHAVVREFLPLSALPAWQLFTLAGICAITLVPLVRTAPQAPPLGLLLSVISLAVLAISAQRHVPLFLWGLTIFILAVSADTTPRRLEHSPRTALAAATLLAVASVLLLTDRVYLLLQSNRRAGWSNAPGVLPEQTLDAMRVLGISGPLFTTYENGALVIHRAPEHRVFIDNRYRPYISLLEDYATVAHAAPGWEQVLDRWEINALLLDPPRLSLIAALHGSPRWALAVLTGDGAVFVRRGHAPEIGARTAIEAWRASHPLPAARFPWQAPPPPREHANMAAMALALGEDGLAGALGREVSGDRMRESASGHRIEARFP